MSGAGGNGSIRCGKLRLWQYPVLLLLGLLTIGCGGGGPQLYSKNEKTGELEPNFFLEDSTPLPGNHRQRAITRSATFDLIQSEDEESEDEDSQDEDGAKNAFEPDPENWRVKPGHWIAVQNQGLSKKDDFNGVLKHSMRKANMRPLAIKGTRYFLRTQRPASLAKEQPKQFESPILVSDHLPLTIVPELQTTSGAMVVEELDRFLPLNDHQYHMVLLTGSPETYRFMTFLPSIWNVRLNRYLSDQASFAEDESFDFSQNVEQLNLGALFYKLTISDWEDAPELPSNVQQWTSIAYLIWTDGFDPADLSEDQKMALLDWLHFGGQLVVCGDAITDLEDSFLGPFLPITPTGQENADGQRMSRLTANWSLERDSNGQLISPTFGENESLVLATWEQRPGSRTLAGCEELVVEGEIGRGRVVCVAFPLNHNKLRSWSGLDNWMNACLLRRPGRRYRDIDSLGYYNSDESVQAGFQWTNGYASPQQASLYTNFRFLSRDLQMSTDTGGDRPTIPEVSSIVESEKDRRYDSPTSSPGAWNDNSAMANSARGALKDQAGITPPKREWVLNALLGYLAVLVPLNYLVFRLLGRLEWAWFSVPIISIIGGIVVVRAASLDIGFSNKRLQINVIELVPDYPRAHVTGYGSLYSSLTTGFRFSSENATTLALPFQATDMAGEEETDLSEYSFHVGSQRAFGPQQVLSNTMEMYHYEQLVNVGGPVAVSQNQQTLSNQSQLLLNQVCLLRHNSGQGTIQYALVDRVPAGQQADLQWNDLTDMANLYDQWQETCFEDLSYSLDQTLTRLEAAEKTLVSMTWQELAAFYRTDDPEFSEALALVADRQQTPPDQLMNYRFALEAFRESRLNDDLSLGRFSRLVSSYPLGPGEVRGFAWSDETIGDFQVTPAASQVQSRNFIIMQLVRPDLPKLESDDNLAYSKPQNQQEVYEE